MTGADVDRSVRIFEVKVNEAVKKNYSEMVQTINNSVRSAIQSFELSLRINVEDLKCNLLEGIKKARRNDNTKPSVANNSSLKNYRPIKNEASGSLIDKFMNKAKEIKRQRKIVEEVDLEEEENNPIAIDEVRISKKNEEDRLINQWATVETNDDRDDRRARNAKRETKPVVKREPVIKREPNYIPAEPTVEDLPNGWKKVITERKSGASVGRCDVKVIGPMGKTFRSKVQLTRYVEEHPDECEGIDLDQIRFSK